MVLGIVIDYSIKIGIWAVCKSYEGVHYLIYGHQETPEEKISRELKEVREELRALKALEAKVEENKENTDNKGNKEEVDKGGN